MASVRANVASSFDRGDITPRQLGPTIRSRCGLASSSICCRSPFLSVIPADSTTTHLVPSAPKLLTMLGAVFAGVITTAMSGGAVS